MTTNVSVHDWTPRAEGLHEFDSWLPEDFEPVPDDYTAGFAEGRAEGLRDAWHLLVEASSKGQTMTEAIQSVYWAWKEAAE